MYVTYPKYKDAWRLEFKWIYTFRLEPFENQTSSTFRNVFIMEDNKLLQTAQF